jgi:poly(A) polymerase
MNSQKYAGSEEDALMRLLHEVATSVGMADHSYVVGGAVRDVALGLDPKDVDVVVETRDGKNAVNLAHALAERLGISQSSIVADQYGVVHVGPVPHDFFYAGVNLKGQKIEIVTARKEVYERGKGKDYKPSGVAPGTITDDLKRRDFSLNTLVFRLSELASGPDKAIIADLLGFGVQDLQNKILRTPIDPNDTFTEDPTRMLRAIRMVVKYGLKFDVQTARSIRNNAHEVFRIPEEKVSEELSKLLQGNNPRLALKLMDAMGLLQYVLPELKALKSEKDTSVDRNVFEYVMNAVQEVDSDLVRRLSLLFMEMDRPAVHQVIDMTSEFFARKHFTSALAEHVLRRLKYPNHIVKGVLTLLDAQRNLSGDLTDRDLRKMKYELGDYLEDLLDVLHARNMSKAKAYVDRDQVPGLRQRYLEMSEEEGLNFLQRLRNPPLDGKEIMSLLGLRQGGPMVGRAMALQRDLILDDPTVSERDIRLHILKAFQTT